MERVNEEGWYIEDFDRKMREIINSKRESRGTYKGVLFDLKDALSIAMTTQDEHDKEIYKRIYDYTTERMREVDENK